MQFNPVHMPIDIKPQYSFRINFNENTRIAEIEKRFPSENIKELLFTLIDEVMKPSESTNNALVNQLENALKLEVETREKYFADLEASTVSINVLQEKINDLQNTIESLQAIESKCTQLENTIETIEKEFVIHPNTEQIHRLELVRKQLTEKHKIEFPTTSHLLDQLVDVAMDRLGYKYAELK